MRTKPFSLKRITSVSLLLYVIDSAYALNLNDALVSTYNTNEALKQKRLDFLNSAEDIAEARAGFLPTISAKVSTNNIKNSPVGKYSTYSSGKKYKTVQNSLIVKQNLLNGQSYAQLQAASSSFKSAKAELDGQEQKILLEAVSAYLEYEYIKAAYEATESSVQLNTKNLEAAEAKLKAGETNKTEVAIALGEMAKAKADKQQAFSNLEKQKANFIQVVGLEPKNLDESVLPTLPTNFDEFKTKVFAYNKSVEALKYAIKASRAKVKTAVGSLLPSLDVQFEFDRTHYDPEASDTYNSRSVTSSLVLNIPLFKGGAEYSQIRQAKNKSRQAALSLDAQMKQLDSQINYYWESLNSLKASLESANVALKARKLAFEGITQEFKVGLRSIIDVLTVQNKLTEDKINRARALREYTFQAYQIKVLMGEMTAEKLQLKVEYFNPDKQLKKIKTQFIGF